MISPTPPHNFAMALLTSDAAKFRWGAGKIIYPASFLISTRRFSLQ
jgi:hypothetical protein